MSDFGVPPPTPPVGYGPQVVAPKPKKAPGERKPIFYVGMVVGLGCLLPLVLLCVGGFGFLAYVGTVGPGVTATEGNQINAHVRKDIAALKLIGPKDRILWFYSDGFISAKAGMYFFTENDLILYCEDWQTPEVRIPLASITDLDFRASAGWPDESFIDVEVGDGAAYHTLPISPEEGKDTLYFEALERAVETARNRPVL